MFCLFCIVLFIYLITLESYVIELKLRRSWKRMCIIYESHGRHYRVLQLGNIYNLFLEKKISETFVKIYHKYYF